MVYLLGYLLIGTLIDIWFLVDTARTNQRVLEHNETPTGEKFTHMNRRTILVLLLIAVLWFLAVVFYLISDDGTPPEPPSENR